MARISLKHEDCYNPVRDISDAIAEYVTARTREIDKVFHQENSKGWLTVISTVDGDQKKFLTMVINGQSDEVCDLAGGLYSLDNLLDLPISKPEPIIEDLVNEGETTLIAGRPKVGKSRLVNQMTLALANGTSFLGMNVPSAKRVFLVDLENKPWSIKDRLIRMSGEHVARNGNIFVWCANTLGDNGIDSSQQGIEKLSMLLHQTKADVLIIDPWRLFLGKDENDAKDVVSGLKALSSLRKNHPALAIVIVHHIRKERFESPAKLIRDPSLWVENISGHYSLVGHVDACYGLERQIDDDGETIVFGGIARNNEPRTILLDEDTSTLRFEVMANEESVRVVMTPTERKLWEKAKALAHFTWSKLFSIAETKNKKLISSMLKKAESHRLIEKTDRDYKVINGG